MALLALVMAGNSRSLFSSVTANPNNETAPIRKTSQTRLLGTSCFGKGLASSTTL